MKLIISCVLLMCSGTVLTPHDPGLVKGTTPPSQRCNDCKPMVFSEFSRVGQPADVELPELTLLGSDSKSVIALRRSFDGPKARTRLIQSDDTLKTHWVAISLNADVGSKVIYASGSGHAKIALIRQSENGVVSRSKDSGASWRDLKLQVDGHPTSEWIHELDDTPGVRAVVRLAAVSPNDSETLFANFELWIPHRGRPTEFAKWREVPGMYVSHDGGDNWILFTKELVADSPLGIGKDPNYFAGVRKDGVVLSRDGGHSWQEYGGQQFLNQKVGIKGRNTASNETASNSVPIRINQIEIAGANASTIYLRTNIGLIITRDGGQTWCVATPGSHVMEEVTSLAVSKRDERSTSLIKRSQFARSPLCKSDSQRRLTV